MAPRELRRALDGGIDVAEAFVCDELVRSDDAREAVRRLAATTGSTSVSEAVFAKLAFGDRSDGMVAIVRTPSTPLEALIAALPAEPLVVVVEGVEKPGNLGAVLRSADGAGADAVIAAVAPDGPLQPERDPGERSARSSRCRSRPRRRQRSWIAWLRERGLRIVAARVDAERAYTDADLTGPAGARAGRRGRRPDGAWAPDGIEAGPPADARRRRQPERLGQRRRPALRGTPAARPDRAVARRQAHYAMDTFDFVIIGAGPAGEAAAYKARELGRHGRGRRPALVRRQLPAHRLPALEVAAPRRRRAPRQPGRATSGRAPRPIATT